MKSRNARRRVPEAHEKSLHVHDVESKLAQLVTWLAEILDRNLIMVPEVDEPQATPSASRVVRQLPVLQLPGI
jgi:hypothetical protein